MIARLGLFVIFLVLTTPVHAESVDRSIPKCMNIEVLKQVIIEFSKQEKDRNIERMFSIVPQSHTENMRRRCIGFITITKFGDVPIQYDITAIYTPVKQILIRLKIDYAQSYVNRIDRNRFRYDETDAAAFQP